MEDFQNLVDQVVLAICIKARGLDEVRYRLFADWLKAHSAQVNVVSCDTVEEPIAIKDKGCSEDRLMNGLNVWFKSLSVRGLLWEYQLIMGEINWWRGVDELSLASILKAEKEYRRQPAGE